MEQSRITEVDQDQVVSVGVWLLAEQNILGLLLQVQYFQFWLTKG